MSLATSLVGWCHKMNVKSCIRFIIVDNSKFNNFVKSVFRFWLSFGTHVHGGWVSLSLIVSTLFYQQIVSFSVCNHFSFVCDCLYQLQRKACFCQLVCLEDLMTLSVHVSLDGLISFIVWPLLIVYVTYCTM